MCVRVSRVSSCTADLKPRKNRFSSLDGAVTVKKLILFL